MTIHSRPNYPLIAIDVCARTDPTTNVQMYRFVRKETHTRTSAYARNTHVYNLTTDECAVTLDRIPIDAFKCKIAKQCEKKNKQRENSNISVSWEIDVIT